MPPIHSTHTTTEMMMTPAHNGSAPFEIALQQDAPAMPLILAQPTLEIRMNTTQTQLPQ